MEREPEEMSPEDITLEMVLKTFLVEAEENLSKMEELLITLETEPENDELFHTIFRMAHTLKGNASSLGFVQTAESAHVVEDLLQRLRNQTLPVHDRLISLLLQAVDYLRRIVTEETEAGTVSSAALNFFRRLPLAAVEGEEIPADAPTQDRRKEPGRREGDRHFTNDRTKTLRIDIDRLDRLLNLAGEVAIAQGRLGQLLEWKGRREDLLEAHQEANRLFIDLQEQVMKIRMVPVGPIFRPHLRTVRDIARAHGKSARLSLEGEEVEVDTTVIEHLKDPLVHMIRNALDHGIEPPDRRKALGKDPCGRLVLRAFHDAGSIVIQLEDDGAGLNRRRIIEKALSKGMIASAEGLSDEEVYRFIFEPGFSTAEAVTDLSGRGVGMDVVKRNIDALRGSISVESKEGKGTTITFRLPLTLAIIEGFAVGVGSETYLLPLEAVAECVELPREESVHPNGDGVISLRGRPLPYLHLRSLFHLGGSPPRRQSVVVVNSGGKEAGLVVDLLHGEMQAVIKSLGKLFQGLPGISGSTILGDGRVALILDVPGLLREAVKRRPERIAG
ncbi:MAG: chemotaxis protein CheA [Candidatus Manganitrophus sp.]|nr:MAG: chemotaxis protein CheA [Candidatus Manganitrophus sp.]WDT79917.1 MAG: chemotaxis protein CheA [Candidatus Manganitrophus sp.]